jgi:hypothetical protein
VCAKVKAPRGPGSAWAASARPIQRLTLHSISPSQNCCQEPRSRKESYLLHQQLLVVRRREIHLSISRVFFRRSEFAIAASLHWRRAADWTLERWSSTSKSLGRERVCVCGASERTHPSPPACTLAFPSSMTQLSFTVVCRLCRITSFHVRFRLEDERERCTRECVFVKVAAAPG